MLWRHSHLVWPLSHFTVPCPGVLQTFPRASRPEQGTDPKTSRCHTDMPRACVSGLVDSSLGGTVTLRGLEPKVRNSVPALTIASSEAESQFRADRRDPVTPPGGGRFQGHRPHSRTPQCCCQVQLTPLRGSRPGLCLQASGPGTGQHPSCHASAASSWVPRTQAGGPGWALVGTVGKGPSGEPTQHTGPSRSSGREGGPRGAEALHSRSGLCLPPQPPTGEGPRRAGQNEKKDRGQLQRVFPPPRGLH